MSDPDDDDPDSDAATDGGVREDAEIAAVGGGDETGGRLVADGGHRHATDRVEGVVIAECPNGCDISVTLEYEDAADNEVLSDLKNMISTCHTCGADMTYLQREEPTEELD